MAFNFNDIVNRSETNGFRVIYNKSPRNVLFIGSCRLASMIHYYNQVPQCRIRNICFIYIPKWPVDRHGELPIAQIKKILETTDEIICENLKSFGVLNTNEKCEQTFFKAFNVAPSTTIYRLPNLELYYQSHYLTHIKHVPFEKEPLYAEYLKSRERLMRSLNTYNARKLQILSNGSSDITNCSTPTTILPNCLCCFFSRT